MYSLYSKNKPKSDDVMAECGSLYFAVSIYIVVLCIKLSMSNITVFLRTCKKPEFETLCAKSMWYIFLI